MKGKRKNGSKKARFFRQSESGGYGEREYGKNVVVHNIISYSTDKIMLILP